MGRSSSRDAKKRPRPWRRFGGFGAGDCEPSRARCGNLEAEMDGALRCRSIAEPRTLVDGSGDRVPASGESARRSQAINAADPRSGRDGRSELVEERIPKRRASAGTVLIREWRGVSSPGHGPRQRRGLPRPALQVASEVARVITGTRWSGPLFFGLKGRAKEAANG